MHSICHQGVDVSHLDKIQPNSAKFSHFQPNSAISSNFCQNVSALGFVLVFVLAIVVVAVAHLAFVFCFGCFVFFFACLCVVWFKMKKTLFPCNFRGFPLFLSQTRFLHNPSFIFSLSIIFCQSLVKQFFVFGFAQWCFLLLVFYFWCLFCFLLVLLVVLKTKEVMSCNLRLLLFFLSLLFTNVRSLSVLLSVICCFCYLWRATSLGPKPSLFILVCFCFLFFCFL